MTTRAPSRVVSLALALCAACAGTTVRRFPTRAPMWRDPDTAAFAPRPRPYASPEVWDTVDNTVFGPMVEVLAVEQVGRARNVNAVDEVPDSSWFENRIARLRGDVAAIARGPCAEPTPDPAGPWTVIGGKPNGANPGFMIRHASGRKFLFKLDGRHQGERASAADVIGSRIFHAAGYFAPCNRVAYLDPSTIELSPTATTEDFVGDTVPFTRAMLDAALARGIQRDDGAIRGGLSELLAGKPLGPWRDFGTRPDDPNDVVPHEDRRELRGSYVFGAWLGHYDAREQNSLDMWIGGDAGYVRHYVLDFGDCLGSLSGWRRVSGRRGHAYEVDWPVALVELITLGATSRPWRDPALGPTGDVLGYFDVDTFTPDRYRTAYRFGPYTRLTEADAAWGARILAQISPAAIHAIVAEAQLSDPAVAAEVERVLLGRRDRLLLRYLTTLSPLTRPHVAAGGRRLCLADARVDAGLDRGNDPVTARAITGLPAGASLAVTPGAGGEVCVGALPTGAAAPAYVVVELRAGATRPTWVHLYATATGYRVAGLDRAE